jgi:S-formylglutathione hydrolase FrmB
MEPWGMPLAGQLDEAEIDSEALRGNPLGDPSARPIWVYLPPSYDAEPDRRFPVLYVIQGFTGQVDMWRNRVAFRPTSIERLDALFAGEDVPPSIVVLVDAWTSLGGSQFVDSPGTGRYHTYLCEDVVSSVDARYRTLASRDHRGIAGKSSGGYGAMVSCMLRPDVFGGLASHAGDTLFELSAGHEWGTVARLLRDRYGGSYERFWETFRSRPVPLADDELVLVEVWAMAACYSADPDGTVRLPFDVATGRMVDEVWARWLEHDPVRMVRHHADALRSLKAIYLDAGTRDEWFLDLGAEAFRRELEAIGVTDVRCELFDAGHFGIEYRYPLALRYLAERLSP